jgi:hypothetical protein
MPVYKRAARPTAAFASDDPRDPQPSDNDFTVLFERAGTPRTSRIPPAPLARQTIEPPRPAPRPPLVARPVRPLASASFDEPLVARERPTPLGMSIPAMDPIETVAIAPRLSVRVLRVAVLFAFGGALGVGVELLAHVEGSGARPEPAAQSVAHVETTAREAATSIASAVVPADLFEERAPVVAPPHRHHVHHPSVPSAASSATTATDPDASPGTEGDDVAAAVQALTKAKEEVSLP